MDEFSSDLARFAATGDYGLVLARTPAYERLPDPASAVRDDLTGSGHISLGVIARASTLRQLGRYVDAGRCDEIAERTARTASVRAAARLGLAADAVGAGDAGLARSRLTAAGELDEPGLRVLAGWVATEIGLMTGDPAAAVVSAQECVRLAREMSGHWHLAKSLLFVGVARVVNGDQAGVAELTKAAAMARGYPALRWVAAAVLADHDVDRRDQWRAEAVAAVGEIAAGLPPDVRAGWLARPEIRPFGAVV